MSDTIRVLVIEDEAHIRMALEYNLQMDGFEVHLAENGRLGIEAVGRVRPDLVLCDWMMPEMNGVEVVREVSV
ncbi:MAG TPA: response regulator [Phycisphaerales bacterium]|nr:response regulator [Phycisphaerales bacterium]